MILLRRNRFRVFLGMPLRMLSTVMLASMVPSITQAADGDTKITVTYQVHSTRVRPQPVKGDGAGMLKLVLHADNTVDDVIEGQGKNPKKWEMKKRKLGPHKSGAVYRIIDRNTIERTTVEKTHTHLVRIVVDKNSCEAFVAYILKPGKKEFETYSPQLGTTAYYSELKPFDVKCKVE